MKKLFALLLAGLSLSAAAQNASEDSAEDVVDLQPQPKPQEQNGLPWYHPSEGELPAPPTPKETQVYTAQLRLFPLNGSDVPFGDAPTGGFTVAAQAESKYAKAMVGLMITGQNTGFFFGGGLGGNIGLRLFQKNELELFVLGPEIEAALTLRENPDPDADEPALGFLGGVNPVGFRVVFCPIKVDVRLNLSLDSVVSQTYGPLFGVSFDVGFIAQ